MNKILKFKNYSLRTDAVVGDVIILVQDIVDIKSFVEDELIQIHTTKGKIENTYYCQATIDEIWKLLLDKEEYYG